MYPCKCYLSPFGKIYIACDDTAIKGLWFEGQKYFGGKLADKLEFNRSHQLLESCADWLDEYFAGYKPPVNLLPIAPDGSSFRQAVWKRLCSIPYGQLISYGEIAVELFGAGMSPQAVGGAVGHNPISIIIPCHRVVGANRSLTGYAGGIDIKQKLLAHEGHRIEKFITPKHSTVL